uniref:Uncharacterized protein n=1 Tax=Eutreptiella gymnastica TaxID=73025 RepID=A0A7S1NF99_9EUGL|mmetsp:Transcript_22644/g.40643  ORF Transcript_22644/g.40643 Transcript_22644/m.40643 type:complete len:833 (+) Transcript_22644:107-2605(+)
MPPKASEIDEYGRAADCIWEADFLLIVAGPAFYEPSSKTPFVSELCDPLLLGRDPDRFYGFWGEFFNRYSERQPNEAFYTLRKWRDNYFDIQGQDLRKKAAAPGKGKEDEEPDTLQRCYAVTAGVDGAFARVGFSGDEVFEIMGSLRTWQCWAPCKPQVWTVDPRFVFEINALGQAKPIKYVEDDRPDFVPEIWEVHDDEDEVPEVDPPPQRDQRGNLKPLSALEKKELAKEKHTKMMKRLFRATVIPLLFEHQVLVPNLQRFADPFTRTPANSLQAPIPFVFPAPPSGPPDDEASPEAIAEAAEAPPAEAPPAGPCQPYILRPRVSHTLAHGLALHYNKCAFQEGVFTEVDPAVEMRERNQRWQEQQKFFSPDQPGLTAIRQKHIHYCISVHIMDSGHTDRPPVLLNPDALEEEESDDHSVATLPPLPGSRPGSRDQIASHNSSRSQRDEGTDSIGVGPLDVKEDEGWPPCQQGEGGRYYFSYVPITKTHTDPDQFLYDTIRIPFPSERGRDQLPRRGKISVIAECCILPEPTGDKKADEEGDGKRKKKAPAPAAPAVTADGSLEPVLEPTQYAACQLVGRMQLPRDRRNGSAHSGDALGEAETVEYRIGSIHGHILKIGIAPHAPRTILYLELECPVMDPARRDPNDFGVSRVRATDPGAGKAAGGVSGRQPLAAARRSPRKRKSRPVPNHQLCLACHDFARPTVAMDPKKDPRCAANPGKKPYQAWETAMVKKQKNEGMALCILELGCEKKPEAARKLSERIFKTTKSSGKASHVRIANEDLNTKKGSGEGDKVVNIVDNIVNAVNNIDRRLIDKLKAKTCSPRPFPGP